ncbi:unannotated protein [freshwater metagenome]|uniref:Unannotated protein n=1 Tax=freshwater metagenome TaxID=449393 RepID=A0A6J6BWS2_9ZZZZ
MVAANQKVKTPQILRGFRALEGRQSISYLTFAEVFAVDELLPTEFTAVTRTVK